MGTVDSLPPQPITLDMIRRVAAGYGSPIIGEPADGAVLITFRSIASAVSFREVVTGDSFGWDVQLCGIITSLDEPVTLTVALSAHVDYPHNPGYLFDCPACERACYCQATGDAQCVWTGHEGGTVSAENNDDDDDGCDGHESLNGANMGMSVYCDGTCRR